MLSQLGKAALVISSLAPVSIGCAILHASMRCPEWWSAGAFLLTGLLCGVLSLLIIEWCRRSLESVPVTLTKVKPADKEVLSFLVVYLLPLMWRESVASPSNWAIGIYVIVILIWAVAHSNSFTFNPVLSLWGYHFYEVEDSNGSTIILLTGKKDAPARGPLRVSRIAPCVFLDEAK